MCFNVQEKKLFLLMVDIFPFLLWVSKFIKNYSWILLILDVVDVSKLGKDSRFLPKTLLSCPWEVIFNSPHWMVANFHIFKYLNKILCVLTDEMELLSEITTQLKIQFSISSTHSNKKKSSKTLPWIMQLMKTFSNLERTVNFLWYHFLVYLKCSSIYHYLCYYTTIKIKLLMNLSNKRQVEIKYFFQIFIQSILLQCYSIC